ncbi:MAG: folate-binding protein [Alphaproteobacteria bacterium]|nr:folate-binding protein [Alphaproteobacteria bacterium]
MSENQRVERRAGRVAISVTGKDAAHLLNDVLSGPVAAEPGPAQWWALLTPQGKILAEGLSAWHEGGFWLDIDPSVVDTFMKRMRLYTLRADVIFTECSQSHVVGWSEGPVADAVSDEDGRDKTLGHRIIAPADRAATWQDGDSYLARRIALGLSELGPDFAADTTFPHDIGMDLLGGVDFEKGCYVGQEVVSRMKHRGTARRRPVVVSGQALAAGAPVTAGEREAGTLGAVRDGKGVAILRLDRIADPQAATVGGAPASLALPHWASYFFGGSGGD